MVAGPRRAVKLDASDPRQVVFRFAAAVGIPFPARLENQVRPTLEPVRVPEPNGSIVVGIVNRDGGVGQRVAAQHLHPDAEFLAGEVGGRKLFLDASDPVAGGGGPGNLDAGAALLLVVRRDGKLDVGCLITAIGQYAVYYNDPNLINTRLDKVAAVTKEDVQRVANQYLVDTNRTVVITMPKAKALSSGSTGK